MGKILTAREVLDAKGYTIKLKFNIEACIRAINEWFKENDAKSCSCHIALPYFQKTDAFADGAEAVNLLVNEQIDKVVPMGSGGQPFFVDKINIVDVVKALQNDYGFQVEKYKMGTYLISLM